MVSLICSPIIQADAQEKKDAYFVFESSSSEYIIMTSKGKFSIDDSSIDFDQLSLLDKKTYVDYQSRVKSKKSKGTYFYDHESGKDNIQMEVPSMEFMIKGCQIVSLPPDSLNQLALKDYQWIKRNAWKQQSPNEISPFRKLFFLCKLPSDEYLKLEVTISIAEH
ncbi:hypothetical protein [Echinicola vietnamensis]|uniref:Uncharacterized protein n=1 Tax=Echinicola vietnamensis (strain DSM 17526 / LMG 23754 / KMM 6221) TaxID=926556 RepID=L0FUK3_ECHVK|nr:hypothetical protein [Echinicola vietnamensis]AGA76982.1 hypothetical protein Echvi_0705 [Echinicola vietnamensis DSM 17526]